MLICASDIDAPENRHMNTYILGVSAYYHDSAAALLKDGRIEAAAQEERFTRKKFDAGFPIHAVRYCLEEGGLTLVDLKYKETEKWRIW
jgi:carbamoyltransferase